jgi:regulator of sigma E protease
LTVVIAIIGFSLLVIIHELGHFSTAKLFGVKVNEFCVGLGPKLFGIKRGETTYAMRLLPFGGACMMEGEDGETDEEGKPLPPSPRSFVAQKPWKRLIILAAGPFLNLLAGFLLFFFLTLPSQGTVAPVIASFGDEYAETGVAGLEIGDEIIRIGGQRVYISGDVSFLLNRYATNNGVCDVVVRRNGEKIVLKDAEFSYGEYTYEGQTYTGYGLLLAVEKNNFWRSLKDSFAASCYYVRLVRFSLVDLIGGKVGLKDMSGPVGITAAMSEVAKTNGYRTFLSLIAFISINLGVMNLLPIPAFDGGRIFFLFIEMFLSLFGWKTVPRKAEAIIHGIGLLLMLGLIGIVTFNDILRLIKG